MEGTMTTESTKSNKNQSGASNNLSRAAAYSVGEKLRTNIYERVDTVCRCGATEDVTLVEYERHGIPHKMVICKECALIRANPMMTQQAYKTFYNNEYRYLNSLSKLEKRDGKRDLPLIYAREREEGKNLLITMTEMEMEFPKTVIDIGCYAGGELAYFKEHGATVYGVEIAKPGADWTREHGIEVVSTVDELLERHIVADLVIMQDMVEHLVDLSELEKIGLLVARTGFLYIWTPGFFRTNRDNMWQIAHTYQFTAHTLNYVMSELGFDQMYINEDILSFWSYVGKGKSLQFPKPTEWSEHIIDEMTDKQPRKMPAFQGTCKFTPKILYGNMRTNLARGIPDIYHITNTYCGSIVVIGGGPSIDGEIDTIKKLISEGAKTMVISRMYPWCADHDIKADFVCSLDSMDRQKLGFAKLQTDTIHLMASVSLPESFDLLKNHTSYIWDTKDDKKAKIIRATNGYRVATVMNGGGSVMISAASLAMNLGFKDYHIFGFDCLMPSREKTHAAGIVAENVPVPLFEATIEGETVITSGPFIEFNRQMLGLLQGGHDEGFVTSVKFYGECLARKVWDGTWAKDEALEEVTSYVKEEQND